ncbi:transcriptional regulator, XRE family [Desulfofarcimen acetoxidans DSM 771]|uniref:Transcriptional regulator, XRE family n=1 Tax=Desulfofarcimen acetoxidans (strain ATCC 49208 / DSM 771 / KCTC 5769 / VKM B-1644 / 5575) TaxID=485916 RepID=C8VWN1_DESAS|nr:helix-turn-helix transcriptional regulator [Desulfofarcimen acetoxidans]ACV64395.1 transcriptional regulator, XRE family [Desulfofarcimen acetoxidans DSM 771]
MNIGNRIRTQRILKDFTQKQLAELVNVSPQVISNWERGYTPVIPHDDVVRLADALGISPAYLLCETDISETPEQQIESAINDDADLLEFWHELKKRDDLQLLFKQVKPLSPKSIKKIIKVIKVIEDEEAMEDL